jgi:methionyl-tRNA synthetase
MYHESEGTMAEQSDGTSGESNMVSFNDFRRIDLRVAKVLSVEAHPGADRLYVLKIDLGTEQRQLVAGLKGHYTPEELLGQSIVIVNNLQPATIRGVESQGMLLAAQDGDKVSIIRPDKDLTPGSQVM